MGSSLEAVTCRTLQAGVEIQELRLNEAYFMGKGTRALLCVPPLRAAG